MSTKKTSDGRYRSTIDQRTATPGVYFKGSHYRVLTRPDGKRKVMHRFDTYEEAVAFKRTTPSRSNQSPSPRYGLRAKSTQYLRNDPCAYCGGPAQALDHIVPREGGGDDDWTNLTAACNSCNSKKRTKSLLMFLAHRNGCWEWRKDI